MHLHRIFIAINLPENIRKELVNFQAKWPELPIRWVKPENLHITLIFLGRLNDEEVLTLCNITRNVAKNHNVFLIKLNKICYGPPKKLPPRMIWVEGEKSKELLELKNDLENNLTGKISFSPENRSFSPHITLGRIRRWEWRQIEPEDRPKVEEDISLSFEVNSIEVMESELKRGGAEYTVLESCHLKS